MSRAVRQNSVQSEPVNSIRSKEIVLDFKVASDSASLHFREQEHDTLGSIELAVDPALGDADRNVRLLRAILDAANAELSRQGRSTAPAFIHAPEALDLSDLQRFPSAA